MKIKTDIRLFAALGILAVLTIAPLSSSVFAQSNSGDNDAVGSVHVEPIVSIPTPESSDEDELEEELQE